MEAGEAGTDRPAGNELEEVEEGRDGYVVVGRV